VFWTWNCIHFCMILECTKPEPSMQVLVVEDSPVYRKLISDHLRRWGFGCAVAETGSLAWSLLQQPDSPKLVLLDWVLPDVDGIELCQRIRQAGAPRPYVYVILLTGKDGQQNMLKAMQAGVDDYLEKPFDESELQARLLVGKRILDLQEELIAARESMRYGATHDSLTGVLNRGEIMEFLNRELQRARRERKTVGVALADIDRFKQVNDSCGHLYGDQALKEVAVRIRSKLRVYDGLGRYGGEEFLLILPGCDSVTAITRADQVREHIAAKPIAYSHVEKVITLSMGVAISDPSKECDAQALLAQADAGLYEAKGKGRNRIEHVEKISVQR
jgi:diguanylate cyclase (GGDEF)-like protein